MAKELIVSVNGREKKIAILENDQVTEFYIERGEEHQGIVGNIYKGRVMRVLPGMQSAFVDIGLERDAFLYVSDFFDEEEEFERIVLEKGKKGDPEAARAAVEKIEKARLEREQRIEAAQEKVETLTADFAAEETDDATLLLADEGSAVAPDEVSAPVAEESKRERDRRRRRDRERDRRHGRNETSQAASPLTEASSFERVADDEASGISEGELFKDALIQERLSDEARAYEYDIAPPATHQFERVADDESEAAPTPATVPQTVAAQAVLFVDEADEATPLAAPLAFERVADEDETPAPAAKGKNNARDKRPARGSRSNKKEAPPVDEAVSGIVISAPEAPVAKSKNQGKEKKAAPKSNSRKKPAKGDKEESLPDAEAKITDSATSTAEFATRRGGRRRRRKPEDGEEESASNDNAPESVAETAAPVIEEAAPREEERSERNNPTPRRDTRPPGGNGGRSDSRPGSGRNEPRNDPRNRSRGGRPDRNERAPVITDLLREGQEILVQIAKEPIARKGARITSHIALPGRFLVYMPTVEHVGVSRKIDSDNERQRLRKLIAAIRQEEDVPSGGFIVRTAGIGISEEDLRADARYLVRTWLDMRRVAERAKAPELVHRDLDLVQRILRDQLSTDFTAIRVDSEEEYQEIVEFINLIQPRLVNRVKLYTRETPILEAFGVQDEIDKAIKPRVWLKSGGYLVITQTEALVSIDVNTGKFVGRGNARLEDTITKTNMEAVDEIARQIRLRDLGGILVLDLIDMEDRRNRQKVLGALHDALQGDKSPTKVLSFNDFGLVIMTRKRVKQSLERTLCAPCSYCQGAGLIKSAQTICYEILEESRRLARGMKDERIKLTTLRVNPEVARALRSTESDLLAEVEDYLGAVDLTSDQHLHQEQFDFAFV